MILRRASSYQPQSQFFMLNHFIRKQDQMERNCLSNDSRANTLATLLAWNFNTDQARTNIKVVFRYEISVIRKFPWLAVRSRKHNTQKTQKTLTQKEKAKVLKNIGNLLTSTLSIVSLKLKGEQWKSRGKSFPALTLPLRS